ncbi:hypothetical protein BD779DRAFT_1800623 [Infundibulicybe gibba]|nr:hypothetical protein BD779DRAFT_1800623 [Infundibulicybe gibba]
MDGPVAAPAILCAETLLYGGLFVLFALSLCLMINVTPSIHGEKRPYPRPMLCFAIIIFILVTVHWVLSVILELQALSFYIKFGSHTSAHPLSRASSVRKDILALLLVAGDLVAIYRLWSVWNHNKRVIIIPVTLFIALCALAVVKIYQATLSGAKLREFAPAWSIARLCLGIASSSINIYCTGMICYRLYKASKDTQDWESISWFKFVGIIMIESLSLYTILGIFLEVTFYRSESVFYPIVLNIGSPIIGIAFMLLHVRVGMRRLGRTAATLVGGSRVRCDKTGGLNSQYILLDESI